MVQAGLALCTPLSPALLPKVRGESSFCLVDYSTVFVRVIPREVAESMRRLDSATSLRSAQNDDGAGDT